MRIGIYDKWLNTLGGGEKVATVMAETLAKKGHQVDLISNFDVDKEELESKMGVDLSKVNLIAWYERSYERLLPRTKKYDVFINVSFLDHLPSEAKKSLYYILFPTPIRSSILGFIKYEKVLPYLRKFMIVPQISSGLTPIDDIHTRGGKWLGRKNTIVLINSPRKVSFTVRIYAEQLILSSLNNVSFSSPNRKIVLVDKYIDHHFNVLTYKLFASSTTKSNLVLKIDIDDDPNKNGYGLVSLTIRDFRYLLWNLFKRFLPRYEIALYGSSSYKPAAGLDTYGTFLADSQYTQKWTKKYWNKNSQVLYPPIDVDKFRLRLEPDKKERLTATN